MMLKKYMNPYRWASFAIALLVVLLIWWALKWLDMPPVYRLARVSNPLFFYQGPILIALAVAVAWFHCSTANALLWVCGEVRRWASALMVMGVVIIDGSMHLLSIPHMEGWWLPIFGGSAFITGMSAWLHQWRKKPQDLKADEV